MSTWLKPLSTHLIVSRNRNSISLILKFNIIVSSVINDKFTYNENKEYQMTEGENMNMIIKRAMEKHIENKSNK